MFTRLQNRLTLIFIALAVIPLMTVSVIVASRSATTVERTAMASLDQVVQRVSIEAGTFIASRVDELQLIANLSDFQRGDERTHLEGLLFRSNVYEEISLVGLDGREIVRYGRRIAGPEQALRDRSADPVVMAAKTSNSVSYSDVFFDDVVREPLMSVAFPVFDIQTGKPVYILTALFSFRPVWEIVRANRLGDDTEAYLLAANHQVIAHQDPSVVFSEALVYLPSVAGRMETPAGEVLFAQTPLVVGDQTLTAVAQRPVSLALALEQENQRIITTITFGALLLAIGLVIVVVHQIVRPIVRLATAAQRIGAGDLTARAEVVGNDEIGQLGVSFNGMAGRLAELIDSLEQQVAERTIALQGALSDVEQRAAHQADLLEQVARQREDILALSVPMLPVDRSTMVLPLVGVFDADRLSQVQERALETIATTATRRLIIDVTGTPVIDTHVAHGLLSVIAAARLLGTEVCLVGIRPEVAQTIVGLGLNLGNVHVFSTLEAALSNHTYQPVRAAFMN